MNEDGGGNEGCVCGHACVHMCGLHTTDFIQNHSVEETTGCKRGE